MLDSNNVEVDVPENTQDRVLEAALETGWRRHSELGSPVSWPPERACAGASRDLVLSQASPLPLIPLLNEKIAASGDYMLLNYLETVTATCSS